MDNERPNERTSWSSRLEEPGALPGTGLTDKETTWDKLYERLKESEIPRRRRMIWFWAAAACLLLILIPAVLLLKDRYKGPRHGAPPIPVAASSGKAHTTPQDRLSSHPANNNPQQSGRPAVQTATASSHPTVAQNSARTRRTPGHQTHHIMARPDLNRLLARDVDTLTLVFARPDLSKPVTVTAAAPLKKELRVVHINELEPSQPTPAMVKGPRQKPGGLRIGLVPQETLRPSTTYAEPEAHSILSLKHTQNP